MYYNTPKSVFELIEAIAATSSKKEKEALVKTGMGLPLFVKVVTAAYDPFQVFGIGKEAVPKKSEGIAPGANTLLEPAPWNFLAALSTRALTGDAAREKVQMWIDMLDEPSAELFRRILMKDMRAGFTDGTLNRVAPGTIAEFPYMRCTLPDKSNMDKWDWSVGIITQEKADGMFTNVNRDKGQAWLTTRAGTPIPLDYLPGLKAAILRHLPEGHQCHGELTVWRNDQLLPREEGNGMLNSVLQGGTLEVGCDILLQVWDAIPFDAVKPKGRYTMPYKQRLANLLRAVAAGPGGPVRVIPTKIVKSKAEAFAYYKDLLRIGREGVICKHPMSEWVDTSSGNKDVVKLKLEVDVDLAVEQILPGDIGSKNEGKPGRLVMRTSDGKLKVNVAVKNEAMRKALQEKPEDFLNRIMPVRANSIMVPSESNELHSLFLPRFVEAAPRADKFEADCLQRVQDQFRNAVEAA